MTRLTAALQLLAAAFLPATSSAPLAINSTSAGGVGAPAAGLGLGPRGQSGCDSSSNAFDYLLLVEQWPKSFGEPGPNDNQFTLHGMW